MQGILIQTSISREDTDKKTGQFPVVFLPHECEVIISAVPTGEVICLETVYLISIAHSGLLRTMFPSSPKQYLFKNYKWKQPISYYAKSRMVTDGVSFLVLKAIWQGQAMFKRVGILCFTQTSANPVSIYLHILGFVAFLCVWVFCLHVCPSYHMCACCLRRAKVLQMIMKQPVGAVNWIRVLCKCLWLFPKLWKCSLSSTLSLSPFELEWALSYKYRSLSWK